MANLHFNLKLFEVYCIMVKFTIQRCHFLFSCSNDRNFECFNDLKYFSSLAAVFYIGFAVCFTFVSVFNY